MQAVSNESAWGSVSKPSGYSGHPVPGCVWARYCSEGALPVSDRAERLLSGGAAAVVEDNPGRGEVWAWLMDATTKLSETWVGTVPEVGYQIVKVK